MKVQQIFIILLLIFVINGCKKKEEQSEVVTPTGSLKINVVNDLMEGIENAIVHIPKTNRSGISNEQGIVIFNDLPIGELTIKASLPTYGSGNAKAKILSHKIIEAEVHIVEGEFESVWPIIKNISPDEKPLYYYKDTVQFSALLTDDNTKPENLIIKWESNIDGVINTDAPNSEGISSFSTNNLSRDYHKITFTVTDTSGFFTKAEISINMVLPGPIKLKEVSKFNKHIKISWSKYTEDDFAFYELYRSVYGCDSQTLELIGTFNNVNDTIFYDKTPPVAYEACYVLKVINTYTHFRLSNSLSIENPAGVVFEFIPDDIVKHPDENIIYLISFNSKKIVKFNYITNEIEAEISLPGEPGYSDIGDNGNGLELYVPCENGRIYILNPADLSEIKLITTYVETLGAIIDGQGNIVASLFINSWNDVIRSYSRSSGANIDFTGSYRGARILRKPGTNEIFSINDNLSSSYMERYKIASDGMFTDYIKDDYHGEHNMHTEIFRMSENGEYLITSYDGSIYLTDEEMTYVGSLIDGGFEFNDFAFNNNDNIIYAASQTERLIKIANYPSLLIDDEIILIGYPKKIITDDDKLIVSFVSEVTDAEKSAIELVDIP